VKEFRELRRLGCHFRRWAVDRLTGRWRVMILPNDGARREGASFPVRLSLTQRILPTDYVEPKIHNINLARKSLENLPIPPRSILSFWHIIGNPSRARGFQPGRSLLGGKLRADYGGGLCQLSGILYGLSLQAALRILERHPHSHDIYDDASRYGPLGSDATVAYGFKDLRVLNTLEAPICFRLEVTAGSITVYLCCAATVDRCELEFVPTSPPGAERTVETRCRCPGEKNFRVVNVSTYRSL
jgi:vancomycin resistance protein VanW